MAYTYDDFTREANKAGLMSTFSKDDLAKANTDPNYGLSMLKLYQDEQNATTAEQRLLAQESIKQLRGSYGSSFAGSGGGTAAATPAAKSKASPAAGDGSFVYDKESSYQKLLNSIVNREDFSYDHEQDPVWSAYKKSYLREGDRATEDTLAAASAATGGVPSSYAVTAAQQAGDYYAGQLSDMIPTLYDDAYQKYLNEFSADVSALGALESDRSFDYSKWLQDYEMEQTEQQKKLQEEQTAYERQQQEYANALALYQTLGYMTPEIAEALGVKGTAADTTLADGTAGNGSGYYGSEYSGYGNGSNSGLTAEQEMLQDAEDDGKAELTYELKAELQGKFQDGIIRNEDDWNELVGLFGEEALAAAGFRYEQEVNVAEEYAMMKRNGAGTRDLDAYLRAAIEAGLITQAEATELRNSRW